MRVLALVAGFALAAAVGAETVSKSAVSKSPDPSDARAAHPPLRFDSGLRLPAGEQAFDPAKHWREHNERARAMGGHVGHVRERSSDPSASESTPAARGAATQGNAK